MKTSYIFLLGICSLLMVSCTDTALFYGMDTTYKIGDHPNESEKLYQEHDSWVKSNNVKKHVFGQELHSILIV